MSRRYVIATSTQDIRLWKRIHIGHHLLTNFQRMFIRMACLSLHIVLVNKRSFSDSGHQIIAYLFSPENITLATRLKLVKAQDRLRKVGFP